MKKLCHIALIDDLPEDRDAVRLCLSQAGHEVIFEAATIVELIAHCEAGGSQGIDLVITEIQPAGMDAVQQLMEQHGIPFIIVSDVQSDEAIELASKSHAFAILVKPVREADLKAAICVATQRFEELKLFQLEAQSLRQALDDRKIIEQAKGIVMRTMPLDEAEAFKHLQMFARQRRQKLVDVARSIVTADMALHPI